MDHMHIGKHYLMTCDEVHLTEDNPASSTDRTIKWRPVAIFCYFRKKWLNLFFGPQVAKLIWAPEIVKKYKKIKCAEFNLLPFGVIENSWDALRLGIQPFLCFTCMCKKCTQKDHQSGGKVTTKWWQSDHKVMAKWPQSDGKVTPGWWQSDHKVMAGALNKSISL